MAEQAEIDAFKAMLPANPETYGWTDTYIGEQLDGDKTENAMLLAFWTKVASDTFEYADMSESGSSRSLSNIHRNAVAMAKIYRDLVDKEENPPTTATGIRSKRIVRV